MDNVMLKSFTINGINDNEMRKFTAWGSVEVKDRHNEIIPMEEVYKVMDYWMAMDAPLMLNHTTQKVGKGLSWRPEEKNGVPGVMITGMIYKYYQEQDEVWEGLKKGDYEGLSIGGKARKEVVDGQTYLRDLIGYEFSVVKATGNQEATFVDINAMAKSNDTKMVKEEKIKVVKEEGQDVANEESEVSIDDRVARLEEAVTNIATKVDEFIQSTAGNPETEKAEDEESEEANKEEDPEETEKQSEEEVVDEEEAKVEEKAEEEDSEMKKEFANMKKEMAIMKKSFNQNKVVSIAKSELPSGQANEKVEKKASVTMTDVLKGRATIQELKAQLN